MTDAVESRAAIIDEYVLSAEEYMSAFALSREVRDLLLNPEDPVLLARAQAYTEDFAAVKGVFEGLYIVTVVEKKQMLLFNPGAPMRPGGP